MFNKFVLAIAIPILIEDERTKIVNFVIENFCSLIHDKEGAKLGI